MGALDEPQSSDSVDPLGDIFATRLFPRTFSNLMIAGSPRLTDDELESIHTVMKSIAPKSPVKHLEQAEAICHGGSDLMNSQFVRSLEAHYKDVALPTRRKENAQERRPGLDRKRAQFSLKPKESQPPVTVELNLDIDQLQDPEEYFNALQKLENAKKELQRQRGENVTVDHRTSRTERHRRPGILGKSVSYKHSSMIGDDTFLSSQETLDQGNTVSENFSSQPEMNDSDVILQEKELTSSISKTESRVNELLTNLFSDESQNLDEERVITFLQESLQIKPIELDKICIPEFHDISKDDLMNLNEQFPRRRKTLSDLSNLVKGLRSKTPTKHKQAAESPVNSLDTPTPPRSPFAAVSSLNRKISDSATVRDPFSTNELAGDQNCSLVEITHGQERQQHTLKETLGPGELTSPIAETSDRTVGASDVNKNVKEDLGNSSENSRRHLVELCRPSDDLDESNCSGNINECVLGDKATRVNSDTDAQANKGPEVNHDMQEASMMPQLSSPGIVNFVNSSTPCNGTEADGPNEMVEDTSGNVSAGVDLECTTISELNTNQNEKDQLSPAPVGSNLEDGPSETATAIPDLVENIQYLTGVSSSEQIATEKSPHGGFEVGIPSAGETIRGPSEESLAEPSLHLGRRKRTCSSKENLPEPSIVSSSGQIATEKSPHGGFEVGMPSAGETIRGPSEESLAEPSLHLGRRKRTRSSKENLPEPSIVSSSGQIATEKSPHGGSEEGIPSAGETIRGPSKESLAELSPHLGRRKRTRSSKENLPEPSIVSSSGQIATEQSPRGARKKKKISSQQGLQDPPQVPLNKQVMPGKSPLAGLIKRTLRSQQVTTENEQITSEQSPRGGRKRRKLSSRTSLGGAGTHWVSGVRRSQRHKMRPLEYWKGERFLYGRVHESLTTVIGVKYVSPDKGSLKVKSYVSEEYKELVEQAALH